MLLIRHCQSSGQDPDAALTEIGCKQAEALAEFLSDYPIDILDPNFGYAGWESLSNPDVFALKEAVDRRLIFERLWSE